MIKILIDIESTGLPETKSFRGFYHPSDLKRYDSSRMIQICAIKLDKDNNELERYVTYCFFKDLEISKEAFQVNKITKEVVSKYGKNIVDVLKELEYFFKDCNLLISHNILFDFNVLLSECYRYNISSFIKKLETVKTYCTMENGRKFTKRNKYPSLVELYKCLFGEELKQKHEAVSDSEYCLKCYLKMNE